MRFANTAMSLRPLYALRSLPPPTPLSPSEAAAAASGSFALGCGQVNAAAAILEADLASSSRMFSPSFSIRIMSRKRKKKRPCGSLARKKSTACGAYLLRNLQRGLR